MGGAQPFLVGNGGLLLLLGLGGVAVEGGQIGVDLTELVLEGSGLAEQPQHALARGLDSALALRKASLQRVAFKPFGLEPLTGGLGIGVLFGDAFAASRQLLAQGREAVVEILEFPLALGHSLLDGADLLGLIVEPPARTLQFQIQLCQPLASFRELFFGLVALGLRAAIFLFLGGGLAGEGFEKGRGQIEFEGDARRFGFEHAVTRRQYAPQLGVHLGLQFFEAAGLGGLAFERIGLAADLFEDVEDALEVVLGALEPGLREPAARLELGDPGGFLDHQAAVLRAGTEELADATLLDDGVGLGAETGAHEDVLDVAEASGAAIDQVLALAGPEQAAGERDFPRAMLEAMAARAIGPVGCAVGSVGSVRGVGGVGAVGPVGPIRAVGAVGVAVGRAVGLGQPDEVEAGIDHGDGDRGQAKGFTVAGTGEDHVLHAGATEGLGGLLAQHPVDGIREVGFPATVGTDNGGHTGTRKTELGALGEGLEPLKFDAFEFKQGSLAPQSDEHFSGARRGPGSRGMRPW